jgi:hypothetical protein
LGLKLLRQTRLQPFAESPADGRGGPADDAPAALDVS